MQSGTGTGLQASRGSAAPCAGAPAAAATRASQARCASALCACVHNVSVRKNTRVTMGVREGRTYRRGHCRACDGRDTRCQVVGGPQLSRHKRVLVLTSERAQKSCTGRRRRRLPRAAALAEELELLHSPVEDVTFEASSKRAQKSNNKKTKKTKKTKGQKDKKDTIPCGGEGLLQSHAHEISADQGVHGRRHVRPVRRVGRRRTL